jgi:hypothetical protein
MWSGGAWQRIGLLRTITAAVVFWVLLPVAAVVTTANGRRVESIIARRSLTVPGVFPGDPFTVKVTGLDTYLARGRTATATG